MELDLQRNLTCVKFPWMAETCKDSFEDLCDFWPWLLEESEGWFSVKGVGIKGVKMK